MMLRGMPLLIAAAAFLAGSCLGSGRASAVEIAVSCGSMGQELELCRQGAEAWAKQTGNSVRLVPTPESATERLAYYQQLLAGQAPDIDVYLLDVVWPGILASHFIDMKSYSKGQEKEHFPAIVENNTVDGKLIAMPFFTDAGLLYYRRDLLEKYGLPVPETWEDMTNAAKKIQAAERQAGNGRIWGFVFQGRAYEGLTANALEWIDSFGGGTIVDAEGNVTIDNPQAAAALKLAQSWVKGIAPEGVLNYSEEEVRGIFQAGDAVFMRNWPYAWALTNGGDSPVRGKVGVAALPRGGDKGKHTGVLGGWNLAVSRYSRHPEVAASLVMYLTGPAEQKRRAIVGAFNPTIPALYQDADVLKANPFLKSLYSTFTDAVARPSRVTGEHYNRVSYAFWEAVHTVLAGQAEPEQALSSLERELKRLGRRGW
jgi:trehalose/maltose transport system substrate-binding protein